MTRRFHPYQQATEPCSGKAQPGTANLMLAILDTYPKTQDWGIYNCRDTASGNLSHHAEGRAGDPGIPMVDGRANTAVGDPIVEVLLEFAWELGLDHLIYNRVIYSASAPDGRPYDGSTPTLRHEDHIHYGQIWDAALTLTYDDAIRLLTGGEEMSIKVGANSRAVGRVKKCYNAWHNEVGEGRLVDETDRSYGPSMADLISDFQSWSGLPATGEVDGVTFAYLTEWSERELEAELKAMDKALGLDINEVAASVDSKIAETRTWTKGKIAAAIAGVTAGAVSVDQVIDEVVRRLGG